MINEVFLAGKVKSATEKNGGKVLDLQVEYKRYYGYGDSAGFSVSVHNVYLVSNTEKTKEFITNSSKSKKPVYIAIAGMIAERTLPPLEESDQKYGPSQNYILGRRVLLLSNEIESSECRAFYQGEVVWTNQYLTKNNKAMTKLIVKQERERKNKDGEKYMASIGLPVTVFKEEIDLPFKKGDAVVFTGNLDSYELKGYPEVFTSTMTSFEYMGTGFSVTDDETIEADEIETPSNSTETVNDTVEEDDDDDSDFPEFPSEDDLPF